MTGNITVVIRYGFGDSFLIKFGDTSTEFAKELLSALKMYSLKCYIDKLVNPLLWRSFLSDKTAIAVSLG